MPIKIQDNLPATSTLEDEHIFIMTETRALSQDIRPLKIIILNLMPTKIETETQILRRLSNTPLQIDITLLQTSTYQAGHVSGEHMLAFYQTFDQIREDNYDGIVDLDYEISLNKSDNVEYMMILENKLSYLTSYVNELAECLNLYQQKISANKKLINNIYYNQEELMRLIDANNYLSCKNDDLILKNKNLKKELDDLNNKKFIRLYKKIFKI